jgi:Protein of unknown function (DUF4231)
MNDQSNMSSSTDPISQRLDEQITWYDSESIYCHKAYKRIKVVEIISAAIIPLVAVMSIPHAPIVTGSLGVLITVLEGLLHLNQYQQNWTTYRSSCEALRHEKYLYLAKASPYAAAGDPYALLAERVESLVSQENAKWILNQQQETKG